MRGEGLTNTDDQRGMLEVESHRELAHLVKKCFLADRTNDFPGGMRDASRFVVDSGRIENRRAEICPIYRMGVIS